MILNGKAHKFGNDVNTDDIIAAKYLNTVDEKELGSHCMETIKPSFSKEVKRGDIIIAGKNFGCGSSREHAPLAIKGCGVSAVIAESFAAIFFRNAINTGLPFLESKDAPKIKQGDELQIDLAKGLLKDLTTGDNLKTQVFPEFLQGIVKAGGLLKWLRKKHTK